MNTNKMPADSEGEKSADSRENQKTTQACLQIFFTLTVPFAQRILPLFLFVKIGG